MKSAVKHSPLVLEDFRNAVRVNPHGLRIAKIDDEPVILGSTKISRFFKSILCPVVQPDGKRTKRLPLGEFLNFLGFHNLKKHTFRHRRRKRNLLDSRIGLRYPVPMFDLVKPQIATAADKLTHLRRFL